MIVDEGINCNGCGDKLHLPTTRKRAEGWERHAVKKDGNLFFTYSCPKDGCADKAIKRLETLRHGKTKR